MYTLTVQAVLSAELFAMKHAFGLTDLGAKGLSVLKKTEYLFAGFELIN